MAEAGGFEPATVSLLALFTSCIESFDVAVEDGNLSEEYEQLCTLFSLQRVRFGLWGESVGLIPNDNGGPKLRYDKKLDRSDIGTLVLRILKNIKSMLDEAERIGKSAGLDTAAVPPLAPSRGLEVFKQPYERLKSRLRKDCTEDSSVNVIRLDIHKAEEFETMINRLRDFVDGLESITKSFGLLEQQHAKLGEEIKDISDVQSLRLLRDATSRKSSLQHQVFETASQRLELMTGSLVERHSGTTLDFSTIYLATTASITNSSERRSLQTDSSASDKHILSGSVRHSLNSGSKTQKTRAIPPLRRPKEKPKPTASCAECLSEHYKCVSGGEGLACTRCLQMERGCSLLLVVHDAEEATNDFHLGPHNGSELISEATKGIAIEDSMFSNNLPQNQRLLSDLIAKAKPRASLTFQMGDIHYGEQLRTIKEEDTEHWANNSGKIVASVNSGSSAAKRMFLELRNIRSGNVPFVSAAPLDDRLDRILASIEGPPETPYEGGVFWITVKLSESDPYGPPLMRFHTKIYHPNISPQGHICADYKDKWNDVLSAGFSKSHVKNPSDVWFSGNSKQIKWSLGALLTALCGLLASPDVEDPLVPEIAMKYLEDYDDYCRSARLFTEQWATGQRPDEADLLFLEDSFSESLEAWKPDFPQHEKPPSVDVVSVQKSLRKIYDDKAPEGINATNQSDPLTRSSQKSYASTLREYSPLSSHMNKPVNFDGMSQDLFSVSQPDPIEQSKDSTESDIKSKLSRLIRLPPRESIKQSNASTESDSKSKLSQLIRLSRENLEVSLLARDREQSDVSIWYSLLEMSVFSRKTRHPESETKDFNRSIKACTDPFLNLCEHGTFEVTEGISPNFYKITIGNVCGIANWTIVRAWDDFRELNRQISHHLPGAEVWRPGSAIDGQANWINYLSDDTIPNTHVMGPLLGFALRSTFLLYGPKFLEVSTSSRILAFFRPTGSLDGNTLRKDETSAFRLAMYGEPLRIINVGAFIPSRLFTVMMVTRVAEYETPVSICVLNHGLSRFSLLVCATLDPGPAQSFDLYTVKDVATSESLMGLDSLPVPMLLSFSISSTLKGDESQMESMSLLFSDWVEFILWYEVLKLFERIAPYRVPARI
ncbi:hypothetical protein BKA64DRAFT_63707 [Cadophora sp. MPI-SDFR-AT-0126]|nr:hypothetical protein BKA64DRAFT_63707 [Leotiomycetes sp. MPI-SDFR-AT-0126]